MENRTAIEARSYVAIWRDERFLRLIGQAAFLLVLAVLLGYLARNMFSSLRQLGLALGFDFLQLTSGFDIGERLIPYDRSQTFLRAFIVGLLNTVLVSGLGILIATLLGILFGVARLSTNFLVRSLATVYIEFLRNIPLLVLLIALYTVVFIQFPRVSDAIILPGPVLISNRGVAIPWGTPTETYSAYARILGAGTLVACGIGISLSWYGRRTGRYPRTFLWIFLTVFASFFLGWLALPHPPLTLDKPAVEGLRLVGGQQLSPEFMALLSGLSIYTSAFIADVVRAGIQSVGKGQVEAAKSLGFTSFQILRLVVFPQALRVIVPPLTSQYLNLTKNSSLAVAIGFPELFHVGRTVLNQSGRAVEVISILMGIYLSISLLTSAFMNWYNARVRFVER
jgi:general L-amino acid transport system permease protein